MNVVAARFYVFGRRSDAGTLRGSGWLEVFAQDESDAIAKAAQWLWPVGTELGAARQPDVFRVQKWTRLNSLGGNTDTREGYPAGEEEG